MRAWTRARTLWAVAGLAMLLAGKLESAGRIPFGPYLAAGALLWLAAGTAVVRSVFLR